jgi:hypothetical protein
MTDWQHWGHLADRYRTPRRRKMLTLDGGGIRGILTIQLLIEIEDQLRKARGAGSEFRLCDYFDYIGGTSTGAIIATGLCIGMSARELHDFYTRTGPEMFEKAALLRRWKNLYESSPLELQLKQVFGETRDLSPNHLRSLLLVVTRNASTDSPWPVSSNPDAKYNDTRRPDCNLRIPLWRLVRASTAAPIYFPPEVVHWDPNDPNKTFIFVDGGVTPYNNPAFLMYRMATLPEFKLSWETGEDKLMLVSLGTGASPTTDGDVLSPGKNVLGNLTSLPGALMYAAMIDQDLNCRAVGRCVAGDHLDNELGNLVRREPSNRAMLYARYNADLNEAGLSQLGINGVDPEKLQSLDAVDQIDNLTRVGQAVAARIDLEGAFGRDWVTA